MNYKKLGMCIKQEHHRAAPLLLLILACIHTDCAAENLQAESVKEVRAPEAIPDTNALQKKSTTCKFWGNSFSHKFHRPQCPFAQAMSPRHVQFIGSSEEAFAMGEKPCKYCLPPYWTNLSGAIICNGSKNRSYINTEVHDRDLQINPDAPLPIPSQINPNDTASTAYKSPKVETAQRFKDETTFQEQH